MRRYRWRLGWGPGVLALGWLLAPGPAPAQTPEQARVMGYYRRAEASWAGGKLADAIRDYEQVVVLAPGAFGDRNGTTADFYNNLAQLYTETGQFAKAEPYHKASLGIREAVNGPSSREVALALNNLGELYRQMGRYGQAEPAFRRCLAIKEAKLGADHPNVALTLNNLADLYRDMRRFADAEPLYLRSLKILEAKLPPYHPQTATTLDNLAHLYGKMDQYEKSIPIAERALAIFRKKLGPDHRDVAICVNNLGAMYEGVGRFADAEPLYRRSLAWNEQQLGPDHPDVIMNLDNLARLAAESGRWDEATRTYDRSRRATRRHVDRVLPSLSEREQLDFLRNKAEPDLHGALGIALDRPDDRAAVEASAAWLLNGKGLAQEALAQRALLARDVKDARLAGTAGELKAARDQLAALTLSAPAPGREADRLRRLGQLAAREEELSKRLGEARGVTTRADAWVGLDEVRAAIPGDAVLVEIARFRPWNYRGKGSDRTWRDPRYVAWVIPAAGKGEVRAVDLGPAGPIERAVAAARSAVRPDPKALRDAGEPAAETQARGPLGELARLALGPLLPHIREARRWVISPDAALWLVPWAALPAGEARYAIEDHPIRFVVSGRDLALPGEAVAAGKALVLADPDFDLDPESARDAARQVLRNPSGAPAPAPVTRGLPGGLGSAPAPRLPGTAAEANAIAPGLRTFAGSEPVLYLGRWALESVFKGCSRPRAVVLATHGYFLDEPEAAPLSPLGGDPGRAGAGPPAESPLLRCGLLLAGCNRRRAARPGDEDGVLTGLEIVGTDLRGTDLVVLSACETGLGDVRNGEGVAGLRQAFQLAGARSVVATLWQVPDKESARLMTAFFDNLARKQDKAEALREAQLGLIKSRRERYGAAHPFFWAAYTLTGQEK